MQLQKHVPKLLIKVFGIQRVWGYLIFCDSGVEAWNRSYVEAICGLQGLCRGHMGLAGLM